jgi:hypothetical protein
MDVGTGQAPGDEGGDRDGEPHIVPVRDPIARYNDRAPAITIATAAWEERRTEVQGGVHLQSQGTDGRGRGGGEFVGMRQDVLRWSTRAHESPTGPARLRPAQPSPVLNMHACFR